MLDRLAPKRRSENMRRLKAVILGLSYWFVRLSISSDFASVCTGPIFRESPTLCSPPVARRFLFTDVFGINTETVLTGACRNRGKITGRLNLRETSNETKTDRRLCANWDGKLWWFGNARQLTVRGYA